MPSAACAPRARSHCAVRRGKARNGRPGSQDTHPRRPSRLALVERGAVSRRISRSLLAALLLSLLVTADGAFTKIATSGPPAACSGTSVGGALETLTAGAWGGANGSVGLSLDTILGETHLFTSGAYWNLLVNDVPASMGICTQELSPG